MIEEVELTERERRSLLKESQLIGITKEFLKGRSNFDLTIVRSSLVVGVFGLVPKPGFFERLFGSKSDQYAGRSPIKVNAWEDTIWVFEERYYSPAHELARIFGSVTAPKKFKLKKGYDLYS
jgi:hypothetical protein